MDDFVDIRTPQQKKATAANLPKTAEERAEALIDLMDRLTDQVEEETRALSTRGANLDELVKRKQPMSLVAEEMARLLRVDRAGFTGLPSEIKDRLRAANIRLNSAAEVNMELLQRMRSAQGRLVDLVVRAVNRDRVANHPAYGPNVGRRAPAVTRLALAPASRGPATSGTFNTAV